MKKTYLMKTLISSLVLMSMGILSFGQCPAGASAATVNWDNLDYLSQTGTYTGFVTTAMMRTQKFAIGRNKLSIVIPSTISTIGENLGNTAEAGSFGTGADVQYNGNGAITITFDTVVYNLKFSLYDIDASQAVTVSAQDPSAVPVPLSINISPVLPGIITVVGNNTSIATATATATAAGKTDTRASLNISIAGNNPATAKGVKKLTVSLSGAAGDFWLSDISACVFGNFPLNYFISEKPWTGQPAYYLVTPDNNSVYLLNPLTGKSDWLFSEPVSPWINSMGYDPVNKILYYIMDNPTPLSSNKSLKKYDFNTETVSTVIADISTLGIPLYEIVVESAGAAFYNGSLFLGVEGTNSAKNSNRESIVWRIDFDATLKPVEASQVFARPADDGAGLLMHDWGDFTIKDGILYDFNTGNQASTAQFVHYDMQTGDAIFYNTNGTPAPIQAGQIWDGTMYWTGGQGSEGGRVAEYYEDGTIGPKIVATATVCSPAWKGRAGDASDPFRPKSDFGDAPDSYDPIPMEKATHEYDCNLRLGLTFDREWDKTASVSASSDGMDEDGLLSVTVLPPGASQYYLQDVRVYNNTGANATLVGWLDYNANGLFEPTEARMMTVPTSSSMQTITLSWLGIPVLLPGGSYTYLRIRLTSATNSMTINDPTKWFANGEVEDYRVSVAAVLPVQVLMFTAATLGRDVELKWRTNKEVNFRGYDIERSTDGKAWERIGFVTAHLGDADLNDYRFVDEAPLAGKSFYRLKLVALTDEYQYSEIRPIEIKSKNLWIHIDPNPVIDQSILRYSIERNETVQIKLIDANGKLVKLRNQASFRGINKSAINGLSQLAPGIYIVQVVTSTDVLSTRFVVQ